MIAIIEGDMKLREQTKELVEKEKFYTARILKNLAVIERQKLFSDYGYPSLFKYLTKELKYSDSEANIRVSAVRLVNRDEGVVEKVAQGTISLTNVAEVGTSLSLLERQDGAKVGKEIVKQAIELGENKSTRMAKEDLRKELGLNTPRREFITLGEEMLAKVDRARVIYGDISAYELFDILLEEKLRAPQQPLRRSCVSKKNSRYIPVAVKHKVYRGCCEKCGDRRNLEYDHIKEFSRGGDNGEGNIQVLCRNCNRRKHMMAQVARDAPCTFA